MKKTGLEFTMTRFSLGIVMYLALSLGLGVYAEYIAAPQPSFWLLVTVGVATGFAAEDIAHWIYERREQG